MRAQSAQHVLPGTARMVSMALWTTSSPSCEDAVADVGNWAGCKEDRRIQPDDLMRHPILVSPTECLQLTVFPSDFLRAMAIPSCTALTHNCISCSLSVWNKCSDVGDITWEGGSRLATGVRVRRRGVRILTRKQQLRSMKSGVQDFTAQRRRSSSRRGSGRLCS